MVTSGNDINGIQYLQPLTGDGYTLDYFNETFTYTKNFRSDGSMRSNFVDAVRPSVALFGYFKVISTTVDAEEISAEMNGGPHTSTGTSGDFFVANDKWADVMDLGITNAIGTTSRVRWEETHPNYSSAFTPTTTGQPIGTIKNLWRGVCGIKVNIDTNNDDRPDKVAIIGAVDTGGLTSGNTIPANTWVVTYKRLFLPSEIALKSIWRPYVAQICHPDAVENTIRIDGQTQADWISTDPNVQPYKYTTCKEVRQL